MKARMPKQMGGSPNNMNDMIKQAQKMQDEMSIKQEEIESQTFTTTAGGGAVEVVMTGKKVIESLSIKPEVVDKDDVEMLQDLVIAAVNEAIRTIEETTASQMEAITGGISIPGLF